MRKIMKLSLLILIIMMISFSVSYTEDRNPIVKEDFDTTYVLYDQVSYIGLMNHLYEGDNGTRLYILPKAEVTTGIGGAIKLFADPYQDNKTDYRDLGIYFYQDQKMDKGYNQNGVYWINSKASGKFYGKNPDIAFSFQDGSAVGGRFSYFYDNGNPRAAFVVGKSQPQISNNAKSVRLEIQGDAGLRNNDMIRWLNTSGFADSGIRFNKADILDFIIRGKSVLSVSSQNIKMNGAISQNVRDEASNLSQINVSSVNVINVKNTANTIVDNFINGIAGQEITLIFTNDYTTIKNNINIRLQNSADFKATANDTLKLIYNGTAWFEVSRSVN